MRKFFIFGMTFVISIVMLITSCKKDESSNNSNSNTDNPEGGNYNNQEYPSTANVIRKAVTDVDGNIYDAVQTDDQVWMAENLRTTKYADGTTIPMGSTYSFTEPYRYAPDNNESKVSTYGYLYNWPAVMHGASSSESNPSYVQGICPTGWHVPSDAEWTQLENYVRSQSQYVCGEDNICIAKALSSTTGWNSSPETCAVGNDPSSNNATGFSALPAGGYYNGYDYFGFDAYFWSATKGYDDAAYVRGLYYNHANVDRYNSYKSCGFSVRCVRDESR